LGQWGFASALLGSLQCFPKIPSWITGGRFAAGKLLIEILINLCSKLISNGERKEEWEWRERNFKKLTPHNVWNKLTPLLSAISKNQINA